MNIDLLGSNSIYTGVVYRNLSGKGICQEIEKKPFVIV